MKSIKELLEAEYLGKTIPVYKSDFFRYNIVFKGHSLSQKDTNLTLKVISVIKEENVCGGYHYRFELEGGYVLNIDKD